jgi:SAM-dependent methyltransferase
VNTPRPVQGAVRAREARLGHPGLSSDQPLYTDEYFVVRYGRIEHQDWDFYADSRLSEHRVQFLSEGLDSASSRPPARFADIGCGLGRQLRLYAPAFRWAVGLDVAHVAANRCRKYGFQGIEGSALALPFADSSLDAVLLNDVLDHFSSEDALQVLRETHRVLRPRGRLCALVLNWHHPTVRERFFDDPTHVRPFTRAALLHLARAAGFSGFVREEIALTGVPGLGLLTRRPAWRPAAFRLASWYATLRGRRVHLVLYATRASS